jgi:hypothetical protein
MQQLIILLVQIPYSTKTPDYFDLSRSNSVFFCLFACFDFAIRNVNEYHCFFFYSLYQIENAIKQLAFLSFNVPLCYAF